MDRRLWVVQTNALPNRDEEYNEWYNSTHIPEVLALPGFVAVQRFQLSATQRFADMPPYPYRYLNVFELEGNPRESLDALNNAIASNSIVASPAMDPDRAPYLFDPLTDRIVSR